MPDPTSRRARRRHDRSRMIERARHALIFRSLSEPERLIFARRFHDDLKMCSCWMCGHRRRWEGPTIQERRRESDDLRAAHSEGW